ncbi:MAG TPA: hypothetical protein VL614_02460 [Acetobacteraceae bacterium]|jgi:hypothetical protein|nr:hypothetical protein [Acetobacteraceae bacterium]
MAITASDLVGRALLLKHDGLEPHEIGRQLVDIARANGHIRVQQAGGGASPDIVEIKLIDTGVTIYFDGRMWGYTLERQSEPRSGQLTHARWRSAIRALSISWPTIRVPGRYSRG